MPVLNCVQGDTYYRTFTLADRKTMQGINITGGVIRFTLRPGFEDDPALSVDITEHDDAAAGLSSLTLTATQTEALSPGAYLCDLRCVWPDGRVLTLTPRGMQFRVHHPVSEGATT